MEVPKLFLSFRIFYLSMLEIKVYSIIVSKVFGVTIVVNFLFAIVKQKFSNCKWVVAIEKMELGSLNGEGERR